MAEELEVKLETQLEVFSVMDHEGVQRDFMMTRPFGYLLLLEETMYYSVYPTHLLPKTNHI